MAGPLMPYRFSAMSIMSGVFIIAVGVFLAVQVEQRRAWPTAEAHVVESKWNYTEDTPQIRVVAQYEVDGTSYQRPLYTDDWDTTDVIPKQYQAGSRIRIYYDPEDGENAVITPGDHWMNVYAICFGLLLVSLGSLSPIHAVLMWHAKRQLRTVEHQMKKFVTNIEAARANLDAMTGKRGPEYEAGLARERELIAQAEELHTEYRALKQELGGKDEAEGHEDSI